MEKEIKKLQTKQPTLTEGVICSSDERLKENIRGIDPSTINRMRAINFREFNFKSDETKRITYGVIAQELLKYNLDELVHEKEDGMLGVDYISLLVLKNASLENDIRHLNNELFMLTKKVNELEDKLK